MTITHRIPGLMLTDHEFQVPIDHTQPDGARLTVFAREAVALDKAQANLPWLVFFSGRARLWRTAPERCAMRPAGLIGR